MDLRSSYRITAKFISGICVIINPDVSLGCKVNVNFWILNHGFSPVIELGSRLAGYGN